MNLIHRVALAAAMLAAAALHSGTAGTALAETTRQALNEADIKDGPPLTLSGGANIQVARGEDDLAGCLLFAIGAAKARADRYSDSEYFELVTTVFDNTLETWRFDKITSFKEVCLLIFTADQEFYGYFARVPLEAVRSVDGRALGASDLALARTWTMILLKEVYKQTTFFRDKKWNDDVRSKFAKYLDDG